MTSTRAKTIVFGVVVATGLLTATSFVVDRDVIPTGRRFLGLALAAVFLLALSDVAPSIAVGFALMLMFAALRDMADHERNSIAAAAPVDFEWCRLTITDGERIAYCDLPQGHTGECRWNEHPNFHTGEPE